MKVPGIHAEPLGELTVRELRLVVLAERLQDAQAEGVPEGLQLFRLVE